MCQYSVSSLSALRQYSVSVSVLCQYSVGVSVSVLCQYSFSVSVFFQCVSILPVCQYVSTAEEETRQKDALLLNRVRLLQCLSFQKAKRSFR